MSIRLHSFLCAVVLALLVVPLGASTVPFAGRLVDGQGRPFAGPHRLTFRLYDAPIGGAPIHADTRVLELRDGAFVTSLGENVILPTPLRSGQTWYASVQAEDGPESARAAVAVPRALAAGDKGKPPNPTTGWSIIGNAGIDPLLNFLGTTDAQPLIVRTDNTERLRVTALGNVGIGTTAPLALLDVAGTVKMTGFRLGTSAIAGQVLTTDASGTGAWQPLPAPPTTLPPSGPAGGDLAGTYPNPTIGASKVTTDKIADSAVTNAKIDSVAWSKVTGAPTSLPPGGAAGGDLTGSYPDPTIAADVVDHANLASDAASLSKVSGGIMSANANGVAVGPGVAPSGPFQVFGASGVIDQQNMADPSIGTVDHGRVYQSFTTAANGTLYAVGLYAGVYTPCTATLYLLSGQSKLTDTGNRLSTQSVRLDIGGRVRIWQLATPLAVQAGEVYTICLDPEGIDKLWRLSRDNTYPGGQASLGDAEPWLDGLDHWFQTYIAGSSIKSALIVQPATFNVGIGTDAPDARLDVAGTAKMTGFRLGLSATAGQVLTTDNTGTGTWQALPAPPTSLPPSGAAGGDLTGTYPDPTIGAAKVTTDKIADGAVATAKIADSAVTDAKITSVAWTKVTGAPTTLPPSGAAGGDLTGTYPDPTIAANVVDNTNLTSDAASLAKVSGGAMTSASGNIGIGTATPGFPLSFPNTVGDKISLYGQTGDHYGLGIQSSRMQLFTSSSGADIVFGWGSSATMTETMRIKGNGNVGIGANPTIPLAIGDSDTGLDSGGAGILRLTANNVDTVTVRPAAVGIGTPAPYDPLDVIAHPTIATGGEFEDQVQSAVTAFTRIPTHYSAVGQSFTVGMTGTLTKINIRVGTGDGSPWMGRFVVYDGAGMAGTVLASMDISGAGGAYMDCVLPTPPSVTLGQMCTWYVQDVSTTSDVLVNVAGNVYPRGTVFAGGGGYASNDCYFRTYVTVAAGKVDNHALLVRDDGNVGIGTMTPTVKLDVIGDIRCTSLTETSSLRYKRDVLPLREDFSKLLQAQPKTYARTGAPDRQEIGYIAEEMDALGLQPLIRYDEQGRPDGLLYNKMVLYLVEIAKEQQSEIDALKAKNAEMEARLKRLEERMNAGGEPAH